MKRFTLIAFLIFCCHGFAIAQNSDGEGLANEGSFYSRIGVGFPTDAGNIVGTNMLGVSYNDPFVSSLSNPAHWGSTVFGLATGGIELNSYAAKDNQSSATNVSFSVKNFQIQLPLYRNKLGLSLSLSPETNISFNNIESESSTISTNGDTLLFASENRGEGGVNRLEAGLGWRINSNISVGYAGSLLFASIDDEVDIDIEGSQFLPVNFRRETSGIGFGNRFGLHLSFPQIFGEEDGLYIGSAISLPVNISSEKVEVSEKVIDGEVQTFKLREGEGLGDGDIRMPFELSSGVSYQVNNLFIVSTEMQYEQWSDYKSDFDDDSGSLVDRFKAGIGLRYNPHLSGSNKFLSQFKYRFGTTYDNGHIMLEGERIKTLMFSFGLGVFSPARNSNSSFDLGFDFGFRGTKSNNLVQENIWGISLSVNLAEIFFNRPKLR